MSCEYGTSSCAVPRSVFFQYPLCGGIAPIPRWAHSAVAIGSKIYIYGGVGTTVLDDLCILDTDTMVWQTLNSSSRPKERPEKMMSHTAAVVGNTIWLFGGQQGRKFLKGLYCLDTETLSWRLFSHLAGPTPRAGHSLTAVASGELYMFGGQGKRLYCDLHKFDTITLRWTEVKARGAVPAPRKGHSMVYDGGDKLVCFGGTNSTSTDNVLHVFSLSRSEWTQPTCSGPAPPPRTQHAALLVCPHVMMVFGGCSAQGVFFSDVFFLDLRQYTWYKPQLLNTSPAPRYYHTCCLVHDKVYLYGGINPKQTLSGVAIIESSFSPDLISVADELCKMAAGSSTPQASAEPLQDMMRLQLRDLLVKRNMEERQLLASRKAEHIENRLEQEKVAKDELHKEVLQLKLMVAELEEAKWQLKEQCKDVEGRLKVSTTELERCRDGLQEANQKLCQQEQHMQDTQGLLNSMAKELGVLSSRYHRLQIENTALREASRRAQSRLACLAGVPVRGTEDEAPITQEASCSRHLTDAGGGDSFLTSVANEGLKCHCRELLRNLEETSSSMGEVRGASGLESGSSGPASPSLWGSNVTVGNSQLQELQMSRLKAENADLAWQLADCQQKCDKLEVTVSRLMGDPTALEECTFAELRGLEELLDGAAKLLRETILSKTVSQLSKQSESSICSLCMERTRSVAFHCGHQCCEECSHKMTRCPFCRTTIAAKIRLYES